MKLERSAGVFAGFDWGAPFESRLPDGEFYSAGAIDSYFANLVRGGDSMLVLRQAQNFASLARHSFAFTATEGVGILSTQLGDLRGLFDARVTLGDVQTALKTAQQIVGGLSSLSESLEGLGSAVPIAGLVINLGLGVVKWIRMIVQSVEKAPPVGQKARAYDRDTDSQVSDVILAAGTEDDWTSIFLPTREGGWVTRPAVYAPTGAADGVFIDQGDWTRGNLGHGIPPQLIEQLGPYQYPKILPGSNRRAGHEWLTGYTKLHPSAVQTGMLFSQRIFKLSHEMFNVDPNRIVEAWSDYFEGARELRASSGDDQLRLQLRYVSSFAGPHGWNRYRKYTPASVPARYHRDHGEGWLGMEGLIRYLMFEVWWSRAMAALGTPLVAYIAPNAPALRSSSQLASTHESRRRLLLTHPRVWGLELDMIPDQAYREAVYQAQMKRGEAKGFQLRTDPKPKVEPVLATFVPGAMPDPPKDADAEPALPESLEPDEVEGGGIGPWAIAGTFVVAAVLTDLYVLRRRRF